MSLRIRQDGTIVCAAMHPEEPGDTYLHDGISYRLTVEHRVIVTEPMNKPGGGWHREHGLWWWKGEEPEWAEIEAWAPGGEATAER